MNVSLHDVREALGELGKFRFGEMRVEDALHEIVHTTHAMFGVDGAGLMLSDAEQQLRIVAASDDRLRHLEEIQIRHSEGPCIAAFEDKELVGVRGAETGACAGFPADYRAGQGRADGTPRDSGPGRV